MGCIALCRYRYRNDGERRELLTPLLHRTACVVSYTTTSAETGRVLYAKCAWGQSMRCTIAVLMFVYDIRRLAEGWLSRRYVTSEP